MTPTAADARQWGTGNFVTQAHGALCGALSPREDTDHQKAASLTRVTVSTPWERSVSFAGHKVLSTGHSLPYVGPPLDQRTQDALSGRSLSPAKHMVPSAGHRVPIPGRSFRRVPSAGTASCPGGALSAHRGAAHPTRTRRLQERTSRLGRSLLPQRSAAHPRGRGPPSPHRPGCASNPAARRGDPGAGVYRVWGRWSGPHPPALRGLSHLPRAYINAAARVPAALPSGHAAPAGCRRPALGAAAGSAGPAAPARSPPSPPPSASATSASAAASASASASAPAAPPPLLAPPQPPQPRARAHAGVESAPDADVRAPVPGGVGRGGGGDGAGTGRGRGGGGAEPVSQLTHGRNREG
ncbi:protein transport protein sec31-like [Onychomys torridus]|uniref:protein transport protein sec31-like n=1 Tax=Onychomys torridus TaxID=38674 RepID=UPI00167FBEAE|nr:protein transport protein sec31-like [Onychomys torridus]